MLLAGMPILSDIGSHPRTVHILSRLRSRNTRLIYYVCIKLEVGFFDDNRCGIGLASPS